MSSYASATIDLPGFYNVSKLGTTITATQIQAALDARSDFADGYISSNYGYAMPLLAPFDPALVRCVCDLGWYDLLFKLRGANPQQGADRVIADAFAAAVQWLRDVQRQVVRLANVPLPTSSAQNGAAPLILSDSPLGIVPPTPFSRRVVG